MKLERYFEKFDQFAEAPDAVEKIRGLVKEMAIQGRLTSQDSAKESAADVLIALSLERKERAAEMRLPARLVAASGASQQYRIPSNWLWATLADVVLQIQYGYTASADPAATDIRMLRITDIQNGNVNWPSVPGCQIESSEVDKYLLHKNDILIARTGGTIGKSFIVPDAPVKSVFASYLIRVTPARSLVARYLKIFLESPLYWRQLRGMSAGTGQPNVNGQALGRLELPLPPFDEQERIVSRVDELMALCDRLEVQQRERETRHSALTRAAVDRFEEAPTLANLSFLFHPSCSVPLPDFRKAILNLAVRGKLLPQDPADETVTDLIRRVGQARSVVRARVYPAIEASETPFEIPISWSWVRLGNIALHSDSGWSPQCDPQARKDDAWGVLKVSAVSWGRFLPEENKALPLDLRAREDCEVKPGDFLVSRANTEDLVARSVVVIDTPPHLMMSDKIVRFAFPDVIDKDFINLVNSASFAREYYARNASGTSSSMKNVGRDVMSNLPVPLPPLAEQRRIVAKTNALLGLLRDMEEMIASSLSMANDLADAIVNELVKEGGK
jgi:type I restriction enzyme S subunit